MGARGGALEAPPTLAEVLLADDGCWGERESVFFKGRVSVRLRKDGPAPAHTLAAPIGFSGLLRKEEGEQKKTRIWT